MEADKFTFEQKMNLRKAREYLIKVNFHANVHSEYYDEIEEMIEYIEKKLQK